MGCETVGLLTPSPQDGGPSGSESFLRRDPHHEQRPDWSALLLHWPVGVMCWHRGASGDGPRGPASASRQAAIYLVKESKSLSRVRASRLSFFFFLSFFKMI